MLAAHACEPDRARHGAEVAGGAGRAVGRALVLQQDVGVGKGAVVGTHVVDVGAEKSVCRPPRLADVAVGDSSI